MIAPRFFPEFRHDTHLNTVDYLAPDWTSQDASLACGGCRSRRRRKSPPNDDATDFKRLRELARRSASRPRAESQARARRRDARSRALETAIAPAGADLLQPGHTCWRIVARGRRSGVSFATLTHRCHMPRQAPFFQGFSDHRRHHFVAIRHASSFVPHRHSICWDIETELCGGGDCRAAEAYPTQVD